MTNITISGARENNLKELNLTIPRNKLVVITGVSGSGKSTLLFDTIFSSSQAGLFDSLSTYARRSMPSLSLPDVDVIEGLSPAISVNQQALARNPRSTVGTSTESYTYLRLLMSRTAFPILDAADYSFNSPQGACPHCNGLGKQLKPNLDRLIDWNKSLNEGAILHKTWKVEGRYWNIISAVGLVPMDIPLSEFSENQLCDLLHKEKFDYQNSTPGYVQNFSYEGIINRLNKRLADTRGSREYDETFFDYMDCEHCHGSRLNKRALEARIDGYNMADLLSKEVCDLRKFIEKLQGTVEETICPPLIQRLKNLEMVGLGYLTLNRSIDTLSGGESQRIKLARQLGSNLIEMIYVLDEPSCGLHPHDIDGLSEVLKTLTQKPNSVLVVEHEKKIMEIADQIIELGPGAGSEGGAIIGIGTPKDAKNWNTPTGQYLKASDDVFKSRTRPLQHKIQIQNASSNNLKNLNVTLYSNCINCITGVSGSGKSSLSMEFQRQYQNITTIDQSGVGSSSRSIVATYVDAFTDIRKEFAKATGEKHSLFSFNSDGACKTCEGLGRIKVDMHFLGDVYNLCPDCNGKRFNQDVLNMTLNEKSINDVLDMTVKEGRNFFKSKKVNDCLRLLSEVGLDYLKIGQPLNFLSGGERQRLKIAERLSERNEIYLFDEPTRGLHHADTKTLVKVINKLVDTGNTVIIIEHDIDIIKSADWIIDLGPGGGKSGGNIIASGRPVDIANNSQSLTGKYLDLLTNV